MSNKNLNDEIFLLVCSLKYSPIISLCVALHFTMSARLVNHSIFAPRIYRRLDVQGARSTAVHLNVQHYFQLMMWIMKVPKEAELHVTFLSRELMCDLHHERKGRPYPTDVLTIAGTGSGRWEDGNVNRLLFGEDVEDDNSDRLSSSSTMMRDELLDLGDIYICPEYIVQRCRRFPNKSLSLLDYHMASYAHAFLHAVGYDHDSDDQFEEMSREERKLMHRIRREYVRSSDVVGMLA